MRALDVWKTTVGDKVDFLDELIAILHKGAKFLVG